MVKTVVNVGGTSRSGSTMLHLILANHERAFASGEAVNWLRPVKIHQLVPKCTCGNEQCPIWRRMEGSTPSTFYRRAFEALDIDLLVDSSKEASWLVDARRWAASQGLSTVNVFVYKEPLDLAYSYWKRGEDVMFWRSQLLMYYRRVQHVGLPLLTVNLNELLANPTTKVEQICRVLDIPHRPGMERFWENDSHHLFGNAGVRRQSERGLSFFQAQRHYPPEFETRIEQLNQSIAGDEEVQALLKVLDGAEVANAFPGAGRRQRFEATAPYPLWYYRQRLKRFIYGQYPRSDEPALAERAGTVPVPDEGSSGVT